jgi:hypothetical protein
VPSWWGRQTPSPGWFAVCGHCRQVWPTPSLRWFPTVTPHPYFATTTPITVSTPAPTLTPTWVPTATATPTPTPTPTPYPGGIRVLEIPVNVEFDYQADRTIVEDYVTVFSFQVVTGTVYAIALEIEAQFNNQGFSYSELYLGKPAVGPVHEWRFPYPYGDYPGTPIQVSMHYEHAFLGYHFPEVDRAVADFENGILFPRPGPDLHRQLGEGWVLFGAGDSGVVKVRVYLNTEFPPRLGRLWGRVTSVWLVYSGDFFYQAPGRDSCVGNNCQRPTPTPTPTVTPTPTPAPGSGSCANPDLGNDVEVIPVPRVAPGLCAGVGPIDLSLPLVGSISVPQIRICFVPIWFGTLDLFGVKVNLDLVFAAAAGAMILRWFWRS